MTLRVKLITPAQVVKINEMISAEAGTESRCYGLGKIESALHSAYYPSTIPFVHGGIAAVAGALAFYLVKAHAFFDGNKRTALLSSTIFMQLNGLDLVYPFNPGKDINALAQTLDDSAAGNITIDELKNWYDRHKKKQD